MSTGDIIRCPTCGAAVWTWNHQCYDDALVWWGKDAGPELEEYPVYDVPKYTGGSLRIIVGELVQQWPDFTLTASEMNAYAG